MATPAGAADLGGPAEQAELTGPAGPAELAALDRREQLRRLIVDLAVIRGRVVLASGRQADYYVDLRRVTLHHQAAPLTGHLLIDLLEERGLVAGEDYAAVGGLTMGADPVAAAMLHAAAARGLDLDAFVVRKGAKAHGLQRQIEGPAVAGRPVIAVEDTSTTGGSVIAAVEALREAGAEVKAVAVIVDRSTGARARIEALGLDYHYLFGLEDLGLAEI
ncbi:MAG: orotate phosphoribosyltransferase [Bifidobacteriaceae bacterium]|jgi:orotate phosphoribosyltransferase|nr:orotate phosphoribosyltransferase [Bifidobacteriaceae bacterium]